MIDYENVHAEGLRGGGELSESDHIVIFFTQNARSIDLCELSGLGLAKLEVIEVPSGKQSADMHIISYLGYLVGEYQSKCRVVIISKDADYDRVIQFWKDKKGCVANRRTQIGEESRKEIEGKDTKESKESSSPIKVEGAIKVRLNMEIIQALRNQGFSAETFNSVASLAVKLSGQEPFPERVREALEEQFLDSRDIFRAIEPVLYRYGENWSSLLSEKGIFQGEDVSERGKGGAKGENALHTDNPVASTKPASSANLAKASKVSLPSPQGNARGKGELNQEIQKILSQAGYKNDIISFTASLAVKTWLKESYKQKIHRDLVQKYGQEEGLRIYRAIKKCL